MARPWSSSSSGPLKKTSRRGTEGAEAQRPPLRSLRLCVSLALLPFLLTSCLDLGVDVVFRTSTSGTVTVDALAWRLAQGLQAVDGPDRIPFPSTRAEWQSLADSVPGASLVSWTGADEDLGFRSKAVLGFSTSRALEGLFVVFKQKLTLLPDLQGKWTVTFVPQVPRVTGGDPATRKLWADLWGRTVWTFGFTPPGQPRSERSVTLADLAGPQPPAEWTLSW